jgi:hypothetical protein
MDVEFVESGVISVACKLDLELHLVMTDGHPARST